MSKSLALLISFAFGAFAQSDCPVYAGNSAGTRYSTLAQINRQNAAKLQVAWTYDTGDTFANSEMQCNPIVVDGVMYATTPKLRLIALDAATGKLRWSFDPFASERVIGKSRNRGVTYWSEGKEKRIFVVVRNYLYSVDAISGKAVTDFGEGGRVDLRQGLGREPQGLSISATTPGIIYRDLLILGSILPETLPAAPGDIRAFDVRTGKVRWTFHTIPHPGELGYETWPKDAWTYIGGANNWAGMCLDEKRGLVFVPTGSAAFDFYGSNRLGDDLFANTLLALNAATGERVWHFQAVKHDLWDRDFPSAPTLVTVQREGHAVDAVAQITKSGYVWVFDRATGKPLFPMEYRNAPKSDVDGEVTAETQPFPRLPPPFARQQFIPSDLVTQRTPEAHAAVLAHLRQVRSDGQFVPPSLQGTVILPGFDGGGEWGGAAFDPTSGLLYVNANEMAWIMKLSGAASARRQERSSAATALGAEVRGMSPVRIGRERRRSFRRWSALVNGIRIQEVETVIRKGKGRMPAFADLKADEISAITRYITKGEDKEVALSNAPPTPIDQKYRFDGYKKFLDPEGYPVCCSRRGAQLQRDRFEQRNDRVEDSIRRASGTGRDDGRDGKRELRRAGGDGSGGVDVSSGPTTKDRKFHVFDKATGKLLWETLLPASGNATPCTYEVKGRQFVVIAAGGGKSGAPSGGSYVAFALPE